MIFWLLLALSTAPSAEDRSAASFSARQGSRLADLCPLLALAPSLPGKTATTHFSTFLRHTGSRCPAFLGVLLRHYPDPSLHARCGTRPLRGTRLTVGTSTFTLGKKNLGFFDLAHVHNPGGHSVTLDLGLRARGKRPLTLYIGYEGTVTLGGRTVTLDGRMVALTLTLPPGNSRITLTLSAPGGPLVLFTRDTPYIKDLPGPLPKTSAITGPVKQDVVLPEKEISFTCGAGDSGGPLAMARAMAHKGINPRRTLDGLKKAKGYSPYLDALIMGRFALARRLFRNASAHFGRAASLSPTALTPLVAQGEIELAMGLPVSALVRGRALRRRFGDCPTILELISSARNKRGMGTLDTIRDLAAANPHFMAHRNLWAMEAIRQGQPQRGISLLFSSFEGGSLQSLAILATYLGKLPRVRTTLAGIAPELRKYILRLALTTEGTCLSAECRTFARLRAQHRRRLKDLPDRGTGANRVLLDTKVLYVDGRGVRRLARQVFVAVGDPAALGRSGSFSLRHSPASEVLLLEKSTIHHPDGSSAEDSAVTSFSEVHDPKARMYYDLLETRLAFGPLARGDVVEIAYTIESRPRGRREGTFHGSIIQMQEFIPTVRGELHLYHPKASPFVHAPTRSGLMTRLTGTVGDLLHTTYIVRSLPGVTIEPSMPGWGETLAAVITGPGLTWREVGRRYAAFIRPQYVLTPEIRALARKLTRGISTREQKIASIHSYLLRTFRYVALMFGKHSYLPYRTGEILSRRFGDCKDMTLLMVLLLRAVGIEAWPAAVRTRLLGNIPTGIPSLALFDHSIVYLPREKRWLDTTTKELRYPEVPPYIQGRPALLISPKGGVLTTTARSSAKHNHEEIQTTITIDRRGDARVLEAVTVQGAGEIPWRLLLWGGRGPSKWDHRFIKKGKVSLTHRGLTSLASPLTVKAGFGLRRLLTRRRRTLFGPLPFYEGEFIKRLAPFPRRHHDLLLDYPGEYRRTITLIPPKGTCLANSPGDLTLTTRHLVFSQKITGHRGSIRIRRAIILGSSRIPAGEYGAFRTAVAKTQALLWTPFTFRPCRQ